MSLDYYEEILQSVLDGEIDDYDGYKRLDSLPIHDIVSIVCHRMVHGGMTVRIRNAGSLINDIADVLARNEAYSWNEALQMYYEHDLDCEKYYGERLVKGIY